MPKVWKLGLLLPLLFLVLSSVGFAATQKNSRGLNMWVDDEWAPVRDNSYWPIRVDMQNTTSEPMLIDVSVHSSGSGYYLRSFELSYEIAAGDRWRTTIPLLMYERGYNTVLKISVNGRPIKDLSVNLSTPGQPYVIEPVVCIVVDTSTPDLRMFDTVIQSYDTHGSGAMHVSLTPNSLPETWLAYKSLDRIWISYEAIRDCSQAARESMMKWVKSGGVMILYRSRYDDITDMEYLHLLFGSKTLPGAVRESTRVSPHPNYQCFAGHIVFLLQDPFADWQQSRLESTVTALNRIKPLKSMDVRRSNVQKIDMEPLNTIVFIFGILGFIILIGPINYFYCWKQKKAWLLLFTTPAISVVVTTLLVGYATVAQGLDVKGKIHSVVILDQVSKTAVTTNHMVYFAGMSPYGGLTFPTDTAVSCNFGIDYDIDDEYYYNNKSSALSVQWGQEQRLKNGWLPARTQTRFSSQQVENQRARLLLHTKDDGTLAVSNGLGVGIQELIVCDLEGNFFHYPAGQGVVATGGSLSLYLEEERPKVDGDSATYVRRNLMSMLQKLQPGTYLAIVDGPLHQEVGLSEVTWMQEECDFTIQGFWEEEE